MNKKAKCISARMLRALNLLLKKLLANVQMQISKKIIFLLEADLSW